MVTKSFTNTLLKETKKWEDLEIISPNQTQQILNYYKQSSKDSYLLFSIIGSLFIGIGVISLIAHNWDELSKMARFCIGVFPLLLAQTVAFYVLRYKSGQKVWMEGVGIFWLLALGGAIAIVGQTYHLGSSLRDFYFLWIVLIFPALFLLKSDGIAFLILVLINLLSFETYRASYDIWFFVLFGLWLVYYTYRIKFYKNTNASVLLSYGLVITSFINIDLLFSTIGFWDFSKYMFLFLLFYYVDLAFFSKLSTPKRAFLLASKFGLSFIAIIFLTFDGWQDTLSKIPENLTIFTLICLLSFFGFIYLVAKKRVDGILYPLVPTLVCILVYFPNLLWVYNILFVAILGFMIYKYSAKGKTVSANYTLGVLCMGLFVKFAINDFGFIAQGVVFITLGFCFLYMNLFIKKRVKR